MKCRVEWLIIILNLESDHKGVPDSWFSCAAPPLTRSIPCLLPRWQSCGPIRRSWRFFLEHVYSSPGFFTYYSYKTAFSYHPLCMLTKNEMQSGVADNYTESGIWPQRGSWFLIFMCRTTPNTEYSFSPAQMAILRPSTEISMALLFGFFACCFRFWNERDLVWIGI